MKRRPSKELAALRDRVDGWRRRQGKRTHIPQELWDAAVEVAKREGLWATSQVTRFNYEKLRQLLQGSETKERRGSREGLAMIEQKRVRFGKAARADDGSGFVELSMGVGGTSGGAVIEVLGRNGDRMRVESSGVVDVVGVVQAFWREQS